MAKAEKLLAKIRNNPKSVSFEDLDRILRESGFTCRQSGKGTSHFYYTCGSLTISVPYKRPHVKEFYVKHALMLIDQVLENNE